MHLQYSLPTVKKQLFPGFAFVLSSPLIKQSCWILLSSHWLLCVQQEESLWNHGNFAKSNYLLRNKLADLLKKSFFPHTKRKNFK